MDSMPQEHWTAAPTNQLPQQSKKTMASEENWEMPATGPRSAHEELVNGITHGIGLLASVVGGVVLLWATIVGGNPWAIAGGVVFSVTMILVYLASTMSHTLHRPKTKWAWRILDQAFIYLLIAGSFTPWALVYLRQAWPMTIHFAMWTVAIGGFISKVFFAHRIDGVATWVYVVLGWLPILAIQSILANIPHAGLWWMMAGGVCYTVGVLFLKLDDHVPFFHAVWHKLVIAGSACQWLAVFWYASN